MTIIVCIKINDGIIISSDSTSSFFRNDEGFVQSYDAANKILNLYRGFRSVLQPAVRVISGMLPFQHYQKTFETGFKGTLRALSVENRSKKLHDREGCT